MEFNNAKSVQLSLKAEAEEIVLRRDLQRSFLVGICHHNLYETEIQAYVCLLKYGKVI